MSSPERASAKPAKSPATKVAAKGAAPKRSRKTDAGEPSSQDKAAFLKALSKGIEPNTPGARAVAKKSGKKTPAAPQPEAPRDEAPKVEVLRRIPAPAKVVDTPESAQALQFAARIEKMVENGDLQTLQPHAQQALVAALCKLYAANTEAGDRYSVLGQRSAVSATDVMIMCGALLKAVDLQVFELGMWQSWSST